MLYPNGNWFEIKPQPNDLDANSNKYVYCEYKPKDRRLQKCHFDNSKHPVQTLFYGDCFDNYNTVPENELFMTFHSLSIPKPKR